MGGMIYQIVVSGFRVECLCVGGDGGGGWGEGGWGEC